MSPRFWFPFMINFELDMLEAQLVENYDRVHKFIVTEAPITHRGRPKPLYYDDNKSHFEPWADKIIHVVCDYLPTPEAVPDPWVRERLQRDAAMAAFMPFTEPDDIVIVSDIDEIPSSAVFSAQPDPYLGGNLYLRFAAIDWPGSAGVMQVLARAGQVSSVDRLRQLREGMPVLDQAGWHLSWFGGPEAIAEKLECFCHLEAYENGIRANGANVMYRFGQGYLPEDGTIAPNTPLDVPRVSTREERDALPWLDQAPMWAHRRECPDIWWRPKDEETERIVRGEVSGGDAARRLHA